jgi:hypothetical protein
MSDNKTIFWIGDVTEGRVTFEVAVRSLIGSDPRNVVRLLVTDHARGLSVSPTESLLSSREARELARMLYEVADLADSGEVERALR